MKNADMPAAPCHCPDKGAREELLLALRDTGDFTVPEIKDMANKMSRHGGLTKREHFAAMAVQGLCADMSGVMGRMRHGDSFSGAVAERAVMVADALLSELERTK